MAAFRLGPFRQGQSRRAGATGGQGLLALFLQAMCSARHSTPGAVPPGAVPPGTGPPGSVPPGSERLEFVV